MSVKRLYNTRAQFFSSTGAVASGYRLFFYESGSSGKLDTFTAEDGLTANTNPIVLDSAGRPQTEIWLTVGYQYKVLFAPPGSDDPPGSTIWTESDISGINDPGQSATAPEWINSGMTATYLTSTTFSVPGDQSLVFTNGRRLKADVTGGTAYPTVVSSVYAPPSTTVTVHLGTGAALDPGLNIATLFYGVLDPAHTSVPSDANHTKNATLTAAATTNIWATSGDFMHISGSTGITSFGTAPNPGGRRRLVFENPVSITHNAATLICPGLANFSASPNDVVDVIAETATQMRLVPLSGGRMPGEIIDVAFSTVPAGWLECDGSAVSRTTYAALFAAIGTAWGVGDGSTTFNLPQASGRARVSRGTAVLSETQTSVTAAANAVPVASNNAKWITGMQVTASAVSGFTGLANGTWFVIRVSATQISFATTRANAQNGTAAAVSGTGSFTITRTGTTRTIGEVGGEDAHAMSSSELLGHSHTDSGHTHGQREYQGAGIGGGKGYGAFTVTNANDPPTASGATTGSGVSAISATGGNAALNIMQPYAVFMTIIKT